MKCRYMIFTFAAGLAIASPALYAIIALCLRIKPGDDISWAFGFVGCIEIYAGGWWLFVMSGLPKKAIAKARAELDALKAGVRGEK